MILFHNDIYVYNILLFPPLYSIYTSVVYIMIHFIFYLYLGLPNSYLHSLVINWKDIKSKIRYDICLQFHQSRHLKLAFISLLRVISKNIPTGIKSINSLSIYAPDESISRVTPSSHHL